MKPFTNYEGIENDKTLSTIQKIVLYQKLLMIQRENRCTSQPTKENYWKNALSREETFIRKC